MARKWFALAKAIKGVGTAAFGALEVILGRKPSKSQLCTLRKVAKFPEDLGKLLDDIEAPWPLVRWIAHAPNPVERDERARQSVGALLDKRESTTHPDRLARAVARDHFSPKKAA